jgi:hypothetical protein
LGPSAFFTNTIEDNGERGQQSMSIVDVDNLLAGAPEVADQRGVPTRVLAVEMLLAATEVITGVEGGWSGMPHMPARP